MPSEKSKQAADTVGGSIPFSSVHAVSNRPATTVEARISKLSVTFTNPADLEQFRGLMEAILEAHLSAIGMEIAMIVRASMGGDQDLGVGAVQATTGSMQRACAQILGTIIDKFSGAGPKVVEPQKPALTDAQGNPL